MIIHDATCTKREILSGLLKYSVPLLIRAGKEPYDVFIVVCKALALYKDHYLVYSYIGFTAAQLAFKIKHEKVFSNQQIYFKTKIIYTVKSRFERGSNCQRTVEYHSSLNSTCPLVSTLQFQIFI